jgi:hypothetical protein
MAITELSIGRFFDELSNRLVLLRDYDEQLDRLVAQRFNLIDFLQPDEYRLSELIALLLDPAGLHGQGPAFLRQFLSRLSAAPAARAFASALSLCDREVSVALEEPTRQGRRIDLVVSLGHSIGIGIENKPWAGAQLGQLSDYAKQLEAQYSTWLLIYLSDTGDPPPMESLPRERRDDLLAAGTYVEWTYPVEFATWLKECSQVCEAEKLRWLIRDFHRYVVSSFGLAYHQETKDAG